MSSSSSITLASTQPDTAAQFVVIDGKPIIRTTTSSEAAELARLDAQIDRTVEKMDRLERELDGYDYRLVRSSSRCHKLIALQDELEALGDRLGEVEICSWPTWPNHPERTLEVSKFLQQKLQAEAAIEAARKALEAAQADAKRQIEEAAKVRRVEIAALVERAGGLELSDGLILAAIARVVDASDAEKKKLEAEAEARFPSGRRRSKSGAKGTSARKTASGQDAADADEGDVESGTDGEEDEGDADDNLAGTDADLSVGTSGGRY